MIGTCHLKPVVERCGEGLQVLLEEGLRGEPKVKVNKGEVSHREARYPPSEYHVDIVGNRVIPRIITGESLENI